MNTSVVLRVSATVCFGLAAFGVAFGLVALVPLGLGLWCASTMA